MLGALRLFAASLPLVFGAFERGDLDETARQGQHAGAPAIEAALLAPPTTDRAHRLAAITAAPAVDGREELLETLATVATGPDRRVAIPAARAAKRIAIDLLRDVQADVAPDDLAPADLDAWRAAWAQLALRGDRWIELRVLALDICAALADAIALYPTTERPDLGPAKAIGVDLIAALADPDPAFVAIARAHSE